ncbi:adaptor protein MecA [Alicyclobacillus cycloheptanicus]|uniref:Adapter protein MecA 1/2 n=1 Tax=Alicyclobacillus cycloheptanicus TaxID=1457 RepID=A0ABT9XDV7_9BACL|nr:adaptor protein MecA [Alicyclobacillus cycloheptanicus]MDQ0188473.1 adapter protein MecA 1/2 [Alicyclobacillus cycloheptanicus]WDM01164.1 adaptor protein MecA [Alicyclobacillus cycloheptanicus]
MHVERLAKDKVRIFVSYDDLEERGIDRDEIWLNGKKVQELFWDMMETAYAEVGFEIAGPIAVEAFTMPSEGVVIIVTRVPSLPGHGRTADDDDAMDVELSDTMFSSFVFSFPDFEDVVRVSYALYDYDIHTSLYQYNGKYQLFVDEDSVQEDEYDSIWSILHEYGEYSEVTTAVLEEYGKCILRSNAVQHIVMQFPL